MNVNKYLRCIADELKKLKPVQSGTYELVIHNGKIAGRKYNHKKTVLPLIARVKSDDIDRGFTEQKWDKVETRIRKFIVEGILS